MKQQCRCCLTTDSPYFLDIFEQHKSGVTFAEGISCLAQIQIEQNDGLPQQICSICYEDVKRLCDFGMNVRLADEKLRHLLEDSKDQIEDEQMENVQVLEHEYFASVDERSMQGVCVMEEIMEHETEQENVLIVEEIHEVNEINMVEEILDLPKEEPIQSYNKKESLLEDLAHVAATQENVTINQQQTLIEDDSYFPQDENDEDYMIEYDPNEIKTFKPLKWKCGECKLILRGDVSYEGHMNIHKQTRPHKCALCQSEFRCRTAFRRHKELRHTKPIKSEEEQSQITYICVTCNSHFYAEIIFSLHQAMVHGQGDKCPFKCPEAGVTNLRDHIDCSHKNELNFTVVNNDSTTLYQCFQCAATFENSSLLEKHSKLCQIIEDTLIQDEKGTVIEIINFEDTNVSDQCNICKKKLLRKNLQRHMELHMRKEEENKSVEVAKLYLCSACPREFKTFKSRAQHEKIHHADLSDVVYVCTDCDRQYASQYLLDTHRKQAHKERDNVCNICGNAFKLRNQLVNHMKLHLEKNIPCPHCDKKYARQFDLNVHLRSHTGEQPYACHLCEKRFAIKVRLTYHLQKHYGIKHYCKECGAEFNSKQKLKAHSFKHTGMPYRCQLCDDHGFATRNTFKRHLTRVHQASISEEDLNEMFQKNTGKSVSIKQVNEQSMVVSASEDESQEMIEIIAK